LIVSVVVPETWHEQTLRSEASVRLLEIITELVAVGVAPRPRVVGDGRWDDNTHWCGVFHIASLVLHHGAIVS
jgi:hypothetical protein